MVRAHFSHRRHNNGMHPTADTTALIYINGAGRRVMPGVSWLRIGMTRRLRYEYHDAGVTGVSIGPRREATLTAKLSHIVAGSDAVVNVRFGGIANFPQVERYLRGVMADVGESYVGRIDELRYDASVTPGPGELALCVGLDGYGVVQIRCRNVAEEEIGVDGG